MSEQIKLSIAKDKHGEFIVREVMNDAEPESVVIFGNIFDRETAALIVHRVNTWDAILQKLKEALVEMNHPNGTHAGTENIIKQAIALADAGGE